MTYAKRITLLKRAELAQKLLDIFADYYSSTYAESVIRAGLTNNYLVCPVAIKFNYNSVEYRYERGFIAPAHKSKFYENGKPVDIDTFLRIFEELNTAIVSYKKRCF